MADQLTSIEVPKLQEFQAGRRELDVADYIDIARRNLPWLIAPAFAGLVLATVIAYQLPDIYVSQATISMTPAEVPDALAPKLQRSLDERVNKIGADLLRRDLLVDLIKRLELYPAARKGGTIEDVVEELKRKRELEVIPLRGGLTTNRTIAFMIKYKYTDRYKAQRMVKELTDKAVTANEESRIKYGTVVSDILTTKHADAKKRLDDVRARMTALLAGNGGTAPDQATALMAQISSLQASRSSLDSQLSRIQQEKIQIEAQLQSLQSRKAALKPPSVEVGQQQVRNLEMERLTAEIARAEAELDAFLRRYTSSHPDVVVRQQNLELMKTRREELAKRMTAPTAPAQRQTVLTREFIAEQREIDDAIAARQADLQARDVQYQDIIRQEKALEGQISAMQSRMSVAPRSQNEFLALMNEQQLAQQQFNEADRDMQAAKNDQRIRAGELDERLDVLEQASLPQSPESPKRLPILIGGFGVGVALGVVLVGFRELRNTSLKTLKDVRAYTQLGILGTIPLLEDDLVTRRRRRLAMIAWSTAILLGFAVMAGSVLAYSTTQGRVL